MNNSVESQWNVDDILQEKTTLAATKCIFTFSERKFPRWLAEKHLEGIEHEPTGTNKWPSALLRGGGIWEPKYCLYNKGFRRATVKKLHTAIEKDPTVLLELGANGPFAMSWVLPKTTVTPVQQGEMERLGHLMFAPSLEVVDQQFSKVDRKPCLRTFWESFEKYVVVGRTAGAVFSL